MRSFWDSLVLTLAVIYFLYQQMKTPTVDRSADPQVAVTCWTYGQSISCIPDSFILPRIEPLSNSVR